MPNTFEYIFEELGMNQPNEDEEILYDWDSDQSASKFNLHDETRTVDPKTGKVLNYGGTAEIGNDVERDPDLDVINEAASELAAQRWSHFNKPTPEEMAYHKVPVKDETERIMGRHRLNLSKVFYAENGGYSLRKFKKIYMREMKENPQRYVAPSYDYTDVISKEFEEYEADIKLGRKEKVADIRA